MGGEAEALGRSPETGAAPRAGGAHPGPHWSVSLAFPPRETALWREGEITPAYARPLVTGDRLRLPKPRVFPAPGSLLASVGVFVILLC